MPVKATVRGYSLPALLVRPGPTAGRPHRIALRRLDEEGVPANRLVEVDQVLDVQSDALIGAAGRAADEAVHFQNPVGLDRRRRVAGRVPDQVHEERRAPAAEVAGQTVTAAAVEAEGEQALGSQGAASEKGARRVPMLEGTAPRGGAVRGV